MKPIKSFFNIMTGVTLGGEAMNMVGNLGSGMSSGLKSATQSMIGVGILSTAIPKNMFKWK